jgi:hypothetical protein
VAVAAIAAIVIATGDGPAPCQVGPEALRGSWDAARKAQIEAALARTSAGYVPATTRTALALGDAYATEWRQMRAAACRATRVAGVQTEAVMELRMACLDDRARALRSAADLLAGADRAVAERAVAAMTALPPIAGCADVAALRSAVPLPADPATRARVEELRDQLATARALSTAGKYADAARALDAIAAPAAALGFAALDAEVLEQRGLIGFERADYLAADTAFERAELAADRARQDELRARALLGRLAIRGGELRDFAGADALVEKAAAVLARLDQPGDLDAELLEARGNLAFQKSELDVAERHLTAALDLITRRHGEAYVRRAIMLRMLGGVLLATDGRADEAGRYFDEALALQRAALGDDHPEVAMAIAGAAGQAYMKSDYDTAIATYETALAMLERSVGTDDHRYAIVLDGLAQAWEWNNDPAKAIALHRRALDIAARALGDQHPHTQRALFGLASALELQRGYDEALALTTRLLAAQEASLPPGHRDVAGTLALIALLHLDKGDHARALELGQRALAAYAQVSDYRPYAELLVVGQALLALGRAGEAADQLQIAVDALGPDDDPRQAAWIRAWLGRALVAANRDRARGLALVREAWPVVAAEPQMEEERADLAPWMRKHGLATPMP